jgi:ABC-type multidrug transport system fused ATPase/permease subunit
MDFEVTLKEALKERNYWKEKANSETKTVTVNVKTRFDKFARSFFWVLTSTTLILIAHRLSSIKHAEKLIYLEDGQVMAEGTFVEVRTAVPNFDIQANLMGL